MRPRRRRLLVLLCAFALAGVPALADEGVDEGEGEGEGEGDDAPVLVILPDDPELDEDTPPEDTDTDDEDFVVILPEDLDLDDDDVAAPPDEIRPILVPRVDVIGTTPELLDTVPGAAAVITEEDLRIQRPVTATEALRTVPGVHVVDEEGFGLRPNVGIRGLDPNRSRKVLVLVDGAPVSMSPYGGPEVYFLPPVETMARVEVVKGSGAILYGPQTIGGVLNFITPDPPADPSLDLEIRTGGHGYYLARAAAGYTAGPVGYRIGVTHGQLQGERRLGLERTLVEGGLRFQSGPTSDVKLNLSLYDESSRSTYVGLTTPQFRSDPRLVLAPNDRLAVRRYGLTGTHATLLAGRALLQTTVYLADTERNWRRQDFDRRDEGRDYERIVDGLGRDLSETDIRPDDGSALYFRDSTGNRNRRYRIAGVEPRITFDWSGGPVDGEVVGGVRVHGERADERRIDGTHAAASSGVIRDDELLEGRAVAAYALTRLFVLPELRVSPGLRVEWFEGRRTVLRTRVVDEETGEAVPTDLEPPATEDTQILALIPGLGATYRLDDQITFFGGVHRGFAPPRTKDAITPDGDVLRLEAEYSWNYELGARYRRDTAWAEATAFLLDFRNQVIPPSEAGGAVAADPEASLRPLVNAGRTLHIGGESAVAADLGRIFDLGFDLPVSLSYTWLPVARFRRGWADGLRGNRLPYAPEHLFSGRVAAAHPAGFDGFLHLTYAGGQFTDRRETRGATVDGTVGRIPGRWLLDGRVGYTFPGGHLQGFLLGKNLFDHRYIASRAPQGIQPGPGRLLVLGLETRL